MKTGWPAVVPLMLLNMAGFLAYALSEPDSAARSWAPALSGTITVGAFLFHGLLWMGARRLWLFAALWLSIGFSGEWIGLATGYPFGDFAYTDKMAPFVFGVPVIVPLAYLVMGYTSLFVSRCLLGDLQRQPDTRRSVARALLATACLVGWDVCADPVRSTVEGRWIWMEDGLPVGVPLSNYAGWIILALVAFLSFEWLQTRLAARTSTDLQGLSLALLSLPIFIHLSVATEYLAYLTFADSACGGDASSLSVVCRKSGLAAIPLMIAPAVLALARLCRRDANVEGNRKLGRPAAADAREAEGVS